MRKRYIENLRQAKTDLTAENKQLRGCLGEAVTLMQGIVAGEYTPDSFTIQPWERCLKEGNDRLKGDHNVLRKL